MSDRVQREGFALVAALTFLLMIAVLVGTVLLAGLSGVRRAGEASQSVGARLAAEAGLEQAFADLWVGIVRQTGPSASLEEYRAALNRVLPVGGTLRLAGVPFGGAAFSAEVTRFDEAQRTLIRTRSVGEASGARRPVVEWVTVVPVELGVSEAGRPRLVVRRARQRIEEVIF